MSNKLTDIENKAKWFLENNPKLKKQLKKFYQGTCVFVNRSWKVNEGKITRLTPDDAYEYVGGYYDKSPWDISDRYVIVLRTENANADVAPAEVGMICLIDTLTGEIHEIGVTHSWNIQQGCMAQWLGPTFDSRIIYNDFRNGKYCSVIYNWKEKKEEKILPIPVYDVSRDGTVALSLDFNRLHRLRPGYGYSNLEDDYKEVQCPDLCCIWKMDITTGRVTELLKYTDFNNFEHVSSMDDAEHKVNHIMINPSGNRFMVLHRWLKGNIKYTRLVTANMDGACMCNLSDDKYVSHSFWKNDHEILSFLRKKESGDHYYILEDKTKQYKLLWPELLTDGHASYSLDREYVITDTYPDRNRISSVYLLRDSSEERRLIARVYSPFKYDNELRCDLHPRWDHKTSKICIDACFEGKREVYIITL